MPGTDEVGGGFGVGGDDPVIGICSLGDCSEDEFTFSHHKQGKEDVSVAAALVVGDEGFDDGGEWSVQGDQGGEVLYFLCNEVGQTVTKEACFDQAGWHLAQGRKGSEA